MAFQKNKFLFIVLLFLALLPLWGCTLPIIGDPYSDSETNALSQDSMPDIIVNSARAARAKVMLYIRDKHGLFVSTNEESWEEKNITPEDTTGSSAYQYITGNWTATVIYPSVPLAEIIYTLLVSNPEIGFAWEGTIDAFGQITENSSTAAQAGKPQSVEPSETPRPSKTPTPTTGISMLAFTDDTYRLALQYPSNWALTVVPAGRVTESGSFAAKSLQLIYDKYRLLIQYKLLWETTEIGQSIPPGTLEVRGASTLLGVEIPNHVVIDNENTKLFFTGDSIDDTTYHIRLENNLYDTSDFENFSIPVDVIEEVEHIIASIVRTGDIFPSPTPTLIPTPTSAFDSSKSGVGSDSTVSEDCNKAEFVSHVTVSEGAALPPGAKFTKTWRIQNVGTCTWNSSYSIGYSDGDMMGAEEFTPFDDEEVPPGATADISIVFTSPDEEGTYTGYWVLYDSEGFWFGLGEIKRGTIPIIIEVVKPSQTYAFDLALDYCEATWEAIYVEDNDIKDWPVSCPGSSSSSFGSVTLIADPNMEHMQDDEFSLWVHPYEQRHATIQGTYPQFEVKAGDTFKAAVGCMKDMENCSLNFELYYIDAAGNLHGLGTWFEDYNESATFISIDLSPYAGQKIQFVLVTKAMSNNTDEAHGFWFVPRVERP